MKRILILALFIMPGLGAFAQQGFHVGLNGSANLTFIINQNNWGRPELEYAPTIGYTGGMALGYNFDRHFGIQAELLSSKQGQNYHEENASLVKTERTIGLTYTHFPLLLKYSGGGDYPIRFYLMAGPQFSFLRHATETFSSDTMEQSIDHDVTDRFEPQDIELVFDLGSDFTLSGNWYMSTGLRFNYGLKDINRPNWQIPGPNKMYSRSQNALGGVYVGVHYVFGQSAKAKVRE
jgi:hypothetical protein